MKGDRLQILVYVNKETFQRIEGVQDVGICLNSVCIVSWTYVRTR